MMTRLEKDRSRIDEIDAQIAELFEERFTVVRDVIDYKIENRIPILNQNREKTIIDKNVSSIKDEDIQPYFKTWYEELLLISKDFQQEILNNK